MKVKWTYSCIFQNVTIGLGLYLCLKRRYRFFLKQNKKNYGFFFLQKNQNSNKKNSKLNTNPKNSKSSTNPENSKSNTTCSKIKEHKPMNLLLFNKRNPNLTLNPFNEHKSTSSRTQTHLNISTISAIE